MQHTHAYVEVGERDRINRRLKIDTATPWLFLWEVFYRDEENDVDEAVEGDANEHIGRITEVMFLSAAGLIVLG